MLFYFQKILMFQHELAVYTETNLNSILLELMCEPIAVRIILWIEIVRASASRENFHF